MILTRAIVRPPASNFDQGLTSVDLGKPDYATALVQHARYCAALRACGLSLIYLEADANFPDSTFVEDTAILTANSAVLARPGASSRMGEVVAIESALSRFFSRIHAIRAPGTLDGGDVCAADNHYFIGISERTNAAGAAQLAHILDREGCTSSLIDIRGIDSIAHLKSGIAFLGERRLVLIEVLAKSPAFADYEIVRVIDEETYAANMLHINQHVIMSSGNPQIESNLRALGYATVALDMSEFRKMDGALSCLSLRF